MDGCQERSFAYPNGNPVLGDVGYAKRLLRLLGLDRTRLDGWVDRCHLDVGATLENYTSVVQPMFPAARGGAPVKWPLEYDRYFVPSFDADGKSLAELWEFVGRMAAHGTWGVLRFHGIGNQVSLTCCRYVFESFVNELAHDSRFVVKTFLEASRDLWPTKPVEQSQAALASTAARENSIVNAGAN